MGVGILGIDTSDLPERTPSEMAGRIQAYNGVPFGEYIEEMDKYPMSDGGKKAAIAGYAGALFEMMIEDTLRLPVDEGLMAIDAKNGVPIINRDTGEIDRYSQEEITIKYASDLIGACMALDNKGLLDIAINTIREPLSAKRPDILLEEADKLRENGYQECAQKLSTPFDEVVEEIKYFE